MLGTLAFLRLFTSASPSKGNRACHDGGDPSHLLFGMDGATQPMCCAKDPLNLGRAEARLRGLGFPEAQNFRIGKSRRRIWNGLKRCSVLIGSARKVKSYAPLLSP